MCEHKHACALTRNTPLARDSQHTSPVIQNDTNLCARVRVIVNKRGRSEVARACAHTRRAYCCFSDVMWHFVSIRRLVMGSSRRCGWFSGITPLYAWISPLLAYNSSESALSLCSHSSSTTSKICNLNRLLWARCFYIKRSGLRRMRALVRPYICRTFFVCVLIGVFVLAHIRQQRLLTSWINVAQQRTQSCMNYADTLAWCVRTSIFM